MAWRLIISPKGGRHQYQPLVPAFGREAGNEEETRVGESRTHSSDPEMSEVSKIYFLGGRSQIVKASDHRFVYPYNSAGLDPS